MNAGLLLLIGMAVMIAVVGAAIVEERSRWEPKGRR